MYFFYLFYCSKFSDCFIVDILYIFFLFDSRYQTGRKVHIFYLVDCRHFIHVLHGCLQICWKEGKGLTDIEWHGLPSKVSIRSNFSHMLHQINLIDYRGSQTRALHKFIHHHNSLLKRTWWKFIHHHRPEERYSILLLGEAFNWPKSVKNKNIDPQDDCNIKRYRHQKIWKGTTRQPSKIEWREMFVVLFSPSLRWDFKIMFCCEKYLYQK